MQHTTSLSLVTAVLGFSLAASPALAQPKGDGDGESAVAKERASRVETHLKRGVEFYAEKQYELAIVEFRAGYDLDPKPELLFALAQAERLSGDCPTAVIYYKQFLDTAPSSNQAEAARVNMKRCQRALESGPGGRQLGEAASELDEASQAAVPPTPIPDVKNEPTSPPTPEGAWYRDPIGGGLAGASAVGFGLGIGFLVAASSAQTDADRAPDYDSHLEALDRVDRNRTIAWVGFGAGAALAIAATVRYVTVDPAPTSLAVVPTRGGATVSLTGRF